jgi:hypothetical protein
MENLQGEKSLEYLLKSVDKILFWGETNGSRPSYLGKLRGG